MAKSLDFIEFSCFTHIVRVINLWTIMECIFSTDFYEIRLASIVSNVDKDVLVELYQPIIGANATILYLTLLKQKRNEDDENTYSMQKLLNGMQSDVNTLLASRHYLEAVGLLRSYEKSSDDGRYYVYVLYAPKSPKDFFDDVLFKGLLIQALGEKEAKKLAFSYKVDLTIEEGFKEVSASFVDVFHPDYDDPSFRKNFGNDLVGHDAGRVRIKFNDELFFKYITENSQIKISAISKKELKEIERLATLFGLDEKQMALIAIDEYDPNELPHLNFERIKYRAEEEVKFKLIEAKPRNKRSDVRGETVLEQKIERMEQIAPSKYLSLLLNNTPPSMTDLNTLNKLSVGYKLGNGIINVIIDYVMEKNNNILSWPFCDKVASILVSKNVETTLDAMNELKKLASKDKETKTTKNTYSQLYKQKETVVKPEKPEKKVEEISDEEMDELLNSLSSIKKGGKK